MDGDQAIAYTVVFIGSLLILSAFCGALLCGLMMIWSLLKLIGQLALNLVYLVIDSLEDAANRVGRRRKERKWNT